MAFRQWEIINTGFSGGTLRYVSHTIHGEAHLVSTSSYPGCFLSGLLYFSQSGTGGAYVGMRPRDDGELDSNGYHCGYMEAQCKQLTNRGDNEVPENTSPMNWGITVMQSTQTLGGGTSCYAFMVDTINYGNFYRLCKMTAGPSSSVGGSLPTTYTLLGTTSSNYWQNGDIHYLRLLWLSDPYFLKGTFLSAHILESDGEGAFLDRELFTIVHTGPDAIASTTSSGQSIYAYGSTNVGVIEWSQTRLARLTVTTVNGKPYPPI